jgi:hypothetical protein
MLAFASTHIVSDLTLFVGLRRKSPISVAAAAIYMISQLNEKEKKPLKGASTFCTYPSIHNYSNMVL